MAEVVDQATTANPHGHRVVREADHARITCDLQAIEGLVGPAGLRVQSVGSALGKGELTTEALALGRVGSVACPVGPGAIHVGDGRAIVRRNAVSEEIQTSANGIRQDFLIHAPPAGTGELALHVAWNGASVSACTDDCVTLRLDGGRDLVWHNLLATDADGTVLHARFQAEAVGVVITVADGAARYPIRIDPTYAAAEWVNVMGSPNGPVHAMAVSGSDLYVGGDFITAGEMVVNRIAKWNGSAWSALGAGVSGRVYALAVSGNDLYVGGDFSTAGTIVAKKIAKWNGSTWSALGSGMDDAGTVSSIAISGSSLYAGGVFSRAGGVAAVHIAKWNGSAWSALGSGISGPVHAVAILGQDVYVGGWFTTAGGVAAHNIARWKGGTWSALGAGVSGVSDATVDALAVVGGDLYVGGKFHIAGELAANNIAKWNGSEWSVVGLGVNAVVRGIAAFGGDIYVGGQFTHAGAVVAKSVAKWNGSTWSGLETNAMLDVSDVAICGSGLYVAGYYVRVCTRHIATSKPSFIKYRSNGGKGTIAAVEAHIGDQLTLSDGAGLTRRGHVLSGWNTAADGSGTAYALGGAFTSDASVTLYAQWTAITYPVVYMTNGGRGSVPDGTKPYGVVFSLSKGKEITRAKHVLKSWNTTAQGTGTAYALGSAYPHDATVRLYAQWQPVRSTTSTKAK